MAKATNGRKNNGGKGSVGAKKKDPKEKAVPITVYPKKGHVDAIGGADIARKIAKDAIDNTKPISLLKSLKTK